MPSEPERYNIEEMMDRLKHRSGGSDVEEGELVERADGTMAVRVRRRKRRSRQPHKERQHRWRVLQVVVLLVLLLAALLASGFAVIFANSSMFRKQVVAGLAASSGARVGLQEFRMNPTAANASLVEFKWPEGGIFDSLWLRQVAADTPPWVVFSGGHLSGREVVAQQGGLVLTSDRCQNGWLGGTTLSAVDVPRFERYSIRQLQVDVSGADGSLGKLDGAEAVLVPAGQGRPAYWLMSGGKLQIPGGSLYALDRAHIEFHGGEARVTSLRLATPADTRGGIMELSGVLTADPSRQPSRLQVTAQSMPISGFIGDGLAGLLDGRVDCEGGADSPGMELGLGASQGAGLAVCLRGSFGHAFELRRLPCLFILSQVLGDPWFGQPTFEDRVSCRVRRDGQKVEIDQIQLVNPQRMLVQGKLSEQAGRLAGKLRIGLLPSAISAAENHALDVMFSPVSDGRRWIELELSGTAAAPGDDFSALYERALQAPKRPTEAQGTGFEELTRPR